MNLVTLSNSQISVIITPNGIQSISLGSKIVTTNPSTGFPTQGLWPAMISNMFAPILGSEILGNSIGPSTLKSTVTNGNTKAIITTQYNNLLVNYHYTIWETDIILGITLENSGLLPFNNFVFALPTFEFGSAVLGNMKSWDSSYILANSPFHPSWWVPWAISYAQDGTYGVALHSNTHFDKPTLFNALIPSPTNGVPPQIADIMFVVQDSVLPGETLGIDLTIHLSLACDIKSITSSYVSDFQEFAGPQQYTLGPKDNYPWLFFDSFDPSLVTADDPLGYDGPDRRFDLPSGILGFEGMVSPVNSVTAGTIFWQPQGVNPRGCEYRADFDVWPPSVQQNLPTLINWYQTNGLRFGLLAQPSNIDVTLNYTTDQVISLNNNEPTQMSMLMSRFNNMTALGVSAYYLDSFGLSIADSKTMKAIRANLGQNVLTFSEFTSDLMLPYSGVYTTLEDNLGNSEWYSVNDIAIMKLLYPECIILTVDPNNNLINIATPQQLLSWGLTPMVQDYLSETYLPYFTEYISGLTI